MKALESKDNWLSEELFSKKRCMLHAFLTVIAIAMATISTTGCQDGIEAGAIVGSDPVVEPFTVRLQADQLPADELCSVPLTAIANGGEGDNYAEWGELRVHALDEVGRFTRLARVQTLYPDIFPSPDIRSGETQTAVIDLERFRRDPSVPVMVTLEFHYQAKQDGNPELNDGRVAELVLSCDALLD